jgi:hypothetical protein
LKMGALMFSLEKVNHSLRLSGYPIGTRDSCVPGLLRVCLNF